MLTAETVEGPVETPTNQVEAKRKDALIYI